MPGRDGLGKWATGPVGSRIAECPFIYPSLRTKHVRILPSQAMIKIFGVGRGKRAEESKDGADGEAFLVGVAISSRLNLIQKQTAVAKRQHTPLSESLMDDYE
jgi:hypothetical protein